VSPPAANFRVIQNHADQTISIDATGAVAGRSRLELTASDQARRWSVTRSADVTVTQDPRVPSLGAVPSTTLEPGQRLEIPLSGQPPANGTPLGALTVTSPVPDSVAATLEGSRLTLHVSDAAVPQGLIPVTVSVQAGAEQAVIQVPVQIGDRIDRSLARDNGLRAQARVPAAALDEEGSMNCWLHGRYAVLNDQLGHGENMTLPCATPEGHDCALHSNLSLASRSLSRHLASTSGVDGLFAAPVHSLGMIHPDVRLVGLGEFTAVDGHAYAKTGTAVRSTRQGAGGPGRAGDFSGGAGHDRPGGLQRR
jgi:hypothetical protein